MFLAATDWRQRDAYAGLLLGLGSAFRRKRILRLTLDVTYWIAYGMSLGYLLYSLERVLLAASSPIFNSASAPLSPDPDFMNLLYATFLSLLVVSVYSLLSRRLNRRDKTQYLEGDRFSAGLVGDPLALLTALYLVWNYPSGALLQRLATDSVAQDRVAALHQRLNAPGSFASWAFRPIPAPLPIMLGPYPASVPLTPETQAEEPGPVPSTRYLVSAPQMIAALPVGVQIVVAPPTITSPTIDPIT
ncbi:MAG: hypothetical protein ABI068_17200 [Ktedonobacterales bacterium]